MFWADKAFELVLTLLGLGLLRSVIKGYLSRVSDHVLDCILVGLFIVWAIISWRIDTPKTELEYFNNLIAKSANDDIGALNELHKISETPTHRFREDAAHTIEFIVRGNRNLPTEPSLKNELIKFRYKDILAFYDQSSSLNSRGSVIAIINTSPHLTDEEKHDLLVHIINNPGGSFLIAQRACSYIMNVKNNLGKSIYDEDIVKCKLYGKLWGY